MVAHREAKIHCALTMCQAWHQEFSIQYLIHFSPDFEVYISQIRRPSLREVKP